MEHHFGTRRIYYNNFGEHLLNAYNPNMTYPGLPHVWSDQDWQGTLEMAADFGFNVFEFWLAPRLFCREGLSADFTGEYIRQLEVAARTAHRRGMKVQWLCALTTVGDDWRTYCPNVPEEWNEVQFLWREWAKRLEFVDIIGFFPGDPGGCSRHGCTALTYIDKCCDIAWQLREILPEVEFEVGSWGPPFFGWGVYEYLPGKEGEFDPASQLSGWNTTEERTREAMEYLIKRLPDFPVPTGAAINMSFDLDSAEIVRDGRPWAQKIAKVAPVYSWDFTLTEGENAILPHYRFSRLFEQRRREYAVGAYSGGICYTMTPWLNQLSLFEAARSFQDPWADCDEVAREFFERVFGAGNASLAEDYKYFEIIREWGNFEALSIRRNDFHQRMTQLHQRLCDLAGKLHGTLTIYPSAEYLRSELAFFSRWMRDLSAPGIVDYAALEEEYYHKVYAIYDLTPSHVDPRSRAAVKAMVNFFTTFQR